MVMAGMVAVTMDMLLAVVASGVDHVAHVRF